MNTAPRKKSPRAPTISLDDAIDKAGKIYDKDRCHTAPIDAVAQHIGYKNAGNGAALSAIATLKYYGLLDRPKEGMASVSKEYEAYRFAPNEAIKQELVTKWLKAPPIFAELLEKYTGTLPSDSTIKYDLIQRGFSPATADTCLQVFRKSVDFARYFEISEQSASPQSEAQTQFEDETTTQPEYPAAPIPATPQAVHVAHQPQPTSAPSYQGTTDGVDRIPVRLAGGRRAWVEIPTPFFEADKERLKKQIDLLITDDDETSDDLL